MLAKRDSAEHKNGTKNDGQKVQTAKMPTQPKGAMSRPSQGLSPQILGRDGLCPVRHMRPRRRAALPMNKPHLSLFL